MEKSEKIRLGIVEDEDLYRQLLGVTLSTIPGIEVIASFADGFSACSQLPGLKPHVVLLDIDLGSELTGVDVGRRLRKSLPDIGIVLLSNLADPAILRGVPEREVHGWSYLLKKSVADISVLVRAIQGVKEGYVVLDPQLTHGYAPRSGDVLSRLTPRQQLLLTLIAQGFSNAGIAEHLNISVRTVENQLRVIYQELDVDTGDSARQPRVSAALRYLEACRRLSPPSRFLRDAQ